MNYPATYNFPDSYKDDGLASFTITLEYPDESPVDLTASKVRMQLRAFDKKLAYEFSSESTEPEKQLIILPNGVIQFPLIKSWDISATKYTYDLEVIDATGFVRTYLQGEWSIKQDITNG
jgi:hypothetical protein